MSRFLALCFFCFAFVFPIQAQNIRPEVVSPHVSPSLKFTENNGQWQSHILFKSTLDGGALYLEKDGVTFDFYDKKKFRELHHGGILKSKYKDLTIQCHAYKMQFLNCNTNIRVEKFQMGSDYENFFVGNDENKWKGNVRNYHEVWLKNLYNGIDYEVITSISGIKYNYHVKTGANPDDIKVVYKGIKSLKIKEGALIIDLEVNGVKEQKPYAYQIIHGKLIQVKCLYSYKNKILGFNFPNGYDKDYELIIDPVLIFAAQSGSNADNFGMTATFDAAGNLYAGGTAYGNGYPVTLGAYQTSFAGPVFSNGFGTDVVITKYNSTGNSLIYSTYIGGNQYEVVSSMIVDNSNNLCFYGATGSNNFPTTSNAFDNTFNGGQALNFVLNGTSFNNGTDIFVSKLNSSGTSLLASTYIGGSGNDGVNHVNHVTTFTLNNGFILTEFYLDSLQNNYGDQYRGEIQVDLGNNIYIASSTRSSNFPTLNAFDNTLGGKQDAVVVKFNSNLSQLVYSTYLGGSSNDCGNSLIVNNAMEVYVTGGTCSPNFPIVSGGHSTVYNGGNADGFITRLSNTGSTVLNSTFIGTSVYDQSYFIQTDKYNNILVYGQSLGNIPVVNSGTIVPFSVSGTHQFISRYNSQLSIRNMSTVFGYYQNRIDISPCAFSVDKCNNLYLSGWGGNIIPVPTSTIMQNMPLFQPTQSTTDGHDFYFMGLDSNFVLKYGSYFGGNQSEEHVDGGTSRFDARGKIYQSACAGCGANDDWPVTPGAWPNSPGNPNYSGNCNNGVVKLDFQLQITLSTINTSTLGGCAPYAATFTNVSVPSNPGASYVWYMGNGLTFTNVVSPTATYTSPGVYTVALVTNDNLTCNKKDSSIIFVTVYQPPQINIITSFNPCTSTVALSGSASGSLIANPYTWNLGDGSPTTAVSSVNHTYTNNGTYTVTFTAKDVLGCVSSKSATLSIFNFTSSVSNTPSVCFGSTTTLNASGGTSYNWSPAISLNNPNVSNPISTPTVSTIYTVNIINNSTGANCSKIYTTQLEVKPSPTANFIFTLNPCGGGASFTDLSQNNIVSWNWILSSTKTSTVQNPYYFYPNGGTFTISLTTTNNSGCKDKKEVELKIEEPPPVTVNKDAQVCFGTKVQLSASGGVLYEWFPKKYLDVYDQPTAIADPLTSIEYSVAITTTGSVNGKSCNFILTTFVQVDRISVTPISANANPATVIVGDSTNLSYIGEPGANVLWLPANLVVPNNKYNAKAGPNKATTYTVLISRGVCSDNLEVSVEAFTNGCIDKDTYIPNTFTPNGDGENDVLYVRGIKVTETYFAVYNRWGELVFETNDKNKGWDGKYKGKLSESGVFGWYLKVKCVNGQESFKKGNVTLVR